MPLSRNLGTLTSWNPLGLSRPVTGLFYLFIVTVLSVKMATILSVGSSSFGRRCRTFGIATRSVWLLEQYLRNLYLRCVTSCLFGYMVTPAPTFANIRVNLYRVRSQVTCFRNGYAPSWMRPFGSWQRHDARMFSTLQTALRLVQLHLPRHHCSYWWDSGHHTRWLCTPEQF